MKEEITLEYICTSNMNPDEVKEWEKAHKGCAMEGNNGGILEFQKSELYSTDENGRKILGSESETLWVAMCDEVYEEEIGLLFSNKESVRKLRDFLNRYLEGCL